MKKLLAAIAALAMLAGPVFAHSDAATTNQNDSSTMTTDNEGAAAGGGINADDVVASQDRVRQVLQNAGMTDVTILDAAYIVQATTPDDETVVMIIDTSGRVMGAQAAPGGQSGSGMSSGRGNLSGSVDSGGEDDAGTDMNNGTSTRSDANGSSSDTNAQ